MLFRGLKSEIKVMSITAQELRDHQANINETYEKALINDIESKLEKVKNSTFIPTSNSIEVDVHKGITKEIETNVKMHFRKRGFNVQFLVSSDGEKYFNVSW